MSDDFDDDFGNDFEGNIDNFDDLIEETNDNQQKREIDFNEFISQTLENYIEADKDSKEYWNIFFRAFFA